MLYGIDGTLVRESMTDASGETRFTDLTGGLYIVRISGQSFKLMVR